MSRTRYRHPSPRSIPDEIKERINSKIITCLQLVEMRHGLKLPVPFVDYNMVGKASGEALCPEWVIRINSILLIENLEDMISDTVPHEVAHLAVYAVYPRRTPMPHGDEWVQMMRLFGLEPHVCHNYDTTNSRVQRKSWAYTCACGGVWELGTRKHRRHQAMKGLAYYCRTCRTFLKLRKEI